MFAVMWLAPPRFLGERKHNTALLFVIKSDSNTSNQ